MLWSSPLCSSSSFSMLSMACLQARLAVLHAVWLLEYKTTTEATFERCMSSASISLASFKKTFVFFFFTGQLPIAGTELTTQLRCCLISQLSKTLMGCVCLCVCRAYPHTQAFAFGGSLPRPGWPVCPTLCPALWPAVAGPVGNNNNSKELHRIFFFF